MPCYTPLLAWVGRNGPTFRRQEARINAPLINLPCGQCIGCKLEKAKENTLRISHEASMSDENIFITLTYAPEYLPKDYGLHHEYFQEFIRSLRKRTGRKIRYYMCGEYGKPVEENDYIARPHFHAILFAYEFPDAYFWNCRDGNNVYRSPLLEKIWPYGQSEIGTVTWQSAGYVARYLVKKQHGENARTHYSIIDWSTGEITDWRKPEYTASSLKPGIGANWFEKYWKTDVYPQDFIVSPDGRKCRVPRYYDKLLGKIDPDLLEQVKAQRLERAKEHAEDNTPERLDVRHEIQLIRAEKLERQII